jgi:putative flippase GtrA
VNRIASQGARFIVAGIAQLLLDWSVFSLFHALTTATIAPNIAGRFAGAMLAFWLNGRFTFADAGQARLGSRRFARYVSLWVGLTVLSTFGMKAIDTLVGGASVYWCKLPVEALMAVLSFFISRHWVYD